MSKGVTVSKLESLLARIRSRAAEPRRAPQAPAAAPQVAHVAAQVAPVAAPPQVAAVAAPQVAHVAPAREPTAPPIAYPIAREATVEVLADAREEKTVPPPAVSESDFAVDVEMPPATPPPPPPPADVDESVGREASESRERLAVAATPASEPPDVAVDAGPSIEQGEILADEEALAGELESEIEAPASSRRPVAAPPEERLAELAFGTGEPQSPRHTPPPKSGRLPAAPPNEFDADVTGVREAVVVSRGEDDQPSARAGEAGILISQATRPNLALGAEARVAQVIGEAQRFAPATFLELLDASLSL